MEVNSKTWSTRPGFMFASNRKAEVVICRILGRKSQRHHLCLAKRLRAIVWVFKHTDIREHCIPLVDDISDSNLKTVWRRMQGNRLAGNNLTWSDSRWIKIIPLDGLRKSHTKAHEIRCQDQGSKYVASKGNSKALLSYKSWMSFQLTSIFTSWRTCNADYLLSRKTLFKEGILIIISLQGANVPTFLKRCLCSVPCRLI